MKIHPATPLLALALLAPLVAWPQVSISVNIAPPPLPAYEQPPAPGDGYLWTPGYWAWNGGYYWVPGTWVLAPRPGYLWTPGYWGYRAGAYRWHAGYWGLSVGFYGGIAYGFGYTGHGYVGGRWERGVFRYNTAVSNVNKTVGHNVYNAKVVNKTYNVTKVSYNGGAAGVKAQPTAAEVGAQHEQHLAATPKQVEHERVALETPTQKASENHGAPQVAATPKAAALDAPDAVKVSKHATTAAAQGGADKTARKPAPTTQAAEAAAKHEGGRQAARANEPKAVAASPAPEADAGPSKPDREPPAKRQHRQPDPTQARAKGEPRPEQ